MKLFLLALVSISLLGCDIQKPNTTKVQIDVGKRGVEVEINKK